MKNVRCEKCGCMNAGDAVFCENCGHRIRRSPVADTLDAIALQTSKALCKLWKAMCRAIGMLKNTSFNVESVRCLIRFLFYVLFCGIIGYGLSWLVDLILGVEYYTDMDAALLFASAFLVYRLLAFAFRVDARKLMYAVAAVLVAVSSWNVYERVERRPSRLEGERKYEQSHTINRTFLGCSFGDSYDDVEKKTDALFTSGKVQRLRLNEEKTYRGRVATLYGVQYGDYYMESIQYQFFRDTLYRVRMYPRIAGEEDFRNDYTYKDIKDMLDKKYHLSWGEKYSNSVTMTDRRTKIILWHEATDNYYNYSVCLTYYDMTSGVEEHFREGF